ncbi:MAG: DUF4430 domain-containing protein [Tractidigestivibacter sp.]|uniref:DUF4430 domain-containing protein n=1 Tax=Tractidigestivibacter sp. TaxID=2847320 RepID=UPI003D8FD92A
MPEDNASGRKVGRVIVGALSAALIAFCVWAMSVYARGGDPLAWIDGSDAFQTTAEQTTGQEGDEAATSDETTTTTVTADDVQSALSALSFDGTDVSLGSDQAKVVLSSDGIWVEQASSDDATTMVEITAQRATALAGWAGEQGVGLTKVTWICEDGSGAVRMAVTMPVDGAPASGATSELLSAATGYAISGDAYSQLTLEGVDQSAGEQPVLPDGTVITVESATTSTGEDLSTSSVSERQEAVNEGTAASSVSAGATTGATAGTTSSSSETSSSASASSSGDDAKISVSVTIDASADGGASSTYSVTLDSGATAYDALVATGANVNARSTTMGLYVSAINGYAEKDQGGESGWKYAVNGSYPGYSAGSYTLSDGDSVLWVYVTEA